MLSKNFYFQVIFKISIITLMALAFAFSWAKENYVFTFISFLILLVQSIILINYVNRTNRKIAYFFDAIKNEDFTLCFSEETALSPSFKVLNKSLNRVNAMIQEVYANKQAQEQYYQEILKHADIGIFTINEQGHIYFANPTVEKLLNYSPLNHINQLTQVNTELHELFKHLKPFERKLFELTNEREKRQLSLKTNSISLDGQAFLLVVIQDIHKELDEKETDSWMRLIRVLVHEIMNTIAPVTSISESILKFFKTDQETVSIDQLSESHIKNTVKGLEVIKEQGNNLMDFVESYRSFLSVPAPDKELISVKKLLEQLILLMEQYHQHYNFEFETHIQPEDLTIYADEKQIIQVLINLTKNAIQSISKQREGHIVVLARSNTAGKKVIEVKDNGPGILPEQLDEIFVPFFTTKTTGTGIGLSLSKQILRLHGGNMKVSSIPNEETVFSLVFE